ncbi:hypothetical protein DICVIV_05845 [Dictyocaulus viviparus]|uniref:Uncharacterized protein n=1 Tax=Dictyocaulus viviparus TaxID=29172 RepID=A0A0D8XU52_DICVI|nr:hypothetical protein DICVIV_05845 [Dictyocaulus viviparus]
MIFSLYLVISAVYFYNNVDAECSNSIGCLESSNHAPTNNYLRYGESIDAVGQHVRARRRVKRQLFNRYYGFYGGQTLRGPDIDFLTRYFNSYYPNQWYPTHNKPPRQYPGSRYPFWFPNPFYPRQWGPGFGYPQWRPRPANPGLRDGRRDITIERNNSISIKIPVAQQRSS